MSRGPRAGVIGFLSVPTVGTAGCGMAWTGLWADSGRVLKTSLEKSPGRMDGNIIVIRTRGECVKGFRRAAAFS